MRLGLVRFLNARPLDAGFRRGAGPEGLTLVDETPSRLCDLLLGGELDAALVSSAEVLRHRNELGYCPSVGVAVCDRARSILYLHPPALRGAPRRIFADRASRSSVALLQGLMIEEYGRRPEIESLPGEAIAAAVSGATDCGGLIIGDAALAYSATPDDRLESVDLAAWWKERRGLPFVFALWAYPIDRPVADAFFEESLRVGLAELARIAAQSTFPGAFEYLSKNLHYWLDERDRQGLEEFRSMLHNVDAAVVAGQEG